MSKKTKSIIFCVISIILLVVIDQISKVIVRDCFGDGSKLVIWDGVLEFLYVKNSGAAWGIFNQHTWILAAISLLMSVVMFICYIKLPATKRFNPLRITIMFVIAGAVGNGIDRFVFKYVTDFIYFKLIDFPVFNIADCYITVCMFVLVFLLLFYYKDEDFDSIKKKKAIIETNTVIVDDEDESSVKDFDNDEDEITVSDEVNND